MPGTQDLFISVDVETAGSTPTLYSMLSIGACMVKDTRQTFYREIKPLGGDFQPESMQVHGLSLEKLQTGGVEPQKAMADFEGWLRKITPVTSRPVFVAFNAPFDWMFVNDYFHRFLGHNPFGHSALDMKAFFAGMTGCEFHRTSLQEIASHYRCSIQLTHHALQDAIDQAVVFNLMLQEAEQQPGE